MKRTSIRTKFRNSEEEIRRLKAELDTCKVHLNESVVRYENEIRILKQENAFLRTSLESTEIDLDSAYFKLANYQQKLEQFDKTSITNLKDKLDELTKHNEFYKERIESLEEELKESSYLELVRKLRERLECPISYILMDSPYILPSGNSVNEDELKNLLMNRQKDPFDRNKIVDVEIPNLALRNISQILNEIEDKIQRLD